MDIQSTEQESESQYVSPEAQSSGLDEWRELGNEVDSGDTPDDVSVRRGDPLDQELVDIPQSLDTFLQSIERRAFVMARYALKNEDDALDTVQDAMLKLCENYSDRPCVEWGPLFYRILNNVIIDRHRPRGMNRLKRWMGWPGLHFEEGDSLESVLDTMDTLPSEQPGPQDELVTNQRSTRINDALSLLSSQQREVFLLRRWQGLSVRETAEAMNIGEGSVKTHLSRAVAALKERLQEQQP